MSLPTIALVLMTGVGAIPPGSYRLDVEVVVTANVPVMGEQRTVTKTTSVVEIDDAGVALARACLVETRGPGFSSRMPPSSLRGLPSSRFAFIEDGGVVRADMGAGTIGYRGAGPLPQSAKDQRVIDPDGDGVPGMQLLLDLGALGQWTLQVVSRGHTVVEGTVTPDGAEGRLIRVESEEQVLSGLPVKLPARSGAIDPRLSRFTLKRVSHGDQSFCAW
jgi:hypothetical protein